MWRRDIIILHTTNIQVDLFKILHSKTPPRPILNTNGSFHEIYRAACLYYIRLVDHIKRIFHSIATHILWLSKIIFLEIALYKIVQKAFNECKCTPNFSLSNWPLTTGTISMFVEHPIRENQGLVEVTGYLSENLTGINFNLTMDK